MYKRIVEALHAHDNVVPSQAIGSQVRAIGVVVARSLCEKM